MKYEVKVPAVGESITEATIGSWSKKNGEAVKQNDVLLSLETDKATVEVVAEKDGVLTISAEAGKTVPIGTVVGFLDSEGKATVATTPSPSPSIQSTQSMMSVSNKKEIHPDLKNHLSPSVQRVVSEKGLSAEGISGTGRDGRLTKSDVLTAPPVASPVASPVSSPVSSPTAPQARVPVSQPVTSPRGPSKQGEQKRVAMTTIRKKIAERLLQSQQTTATLTTFNEIDMTHVIAIRSKYKEQFKEKYGVGLGFMGFFVKAAIEALKANPAVNAFIDGQDLIYNNYYNVGVAVGTEKGLIVPVIKDADQLSIAGVEMAIRDYALKARDGKISIDDLSGGTFTISNGGVYGSLMSTPILNPPQSAILGLHKIEDRAVVINGKIEIRSMMYVAVSYDHRIIDGKEAVTFLVKIKEGIENPERLLIEV